MEVQDFRSQYNPTYLPKDKEIYLIEYTDITQGISLDINRELIDIIPNKKNNNYKKLPSDVYPFTYINGLPSALKTFVF